MDLKMSTFNSQDEYNFLSPGSRIPEFTWINEKGQTLSSASFIGKFTLVILFTTGCRHCKNNFAYLETKLLPLFKSSLNLLAICRSCDNQQVADFRERHPISIDTIPDPNGDIFSKFAEKAVPRNYMFDPSGKLVSSIRGYWPDKIDLMAKMIADVLPE